MIAIPLLFKKFHNMKLILNLHFYPFDLNPPGVCAVIQHVLKHNGLTLDYVPHMQVQSKEQHTIIDN